MSDYEFESDEEYEEEYGFVDCGKYDPDEDVKFKYRKDGKATELCASKNMKVDDLISYFEELCGVEDDDHFSIIYMDTDRQNKNLRDLTTQSRQRTIIDVLGNRFLLTIDHAKNTEEESNLSSEVEMFDRVMEELLHEEHDRDLPTNYRVLIRELNKEFDYATTFAILKSLDDHVHGIRDLSSNRRVMIQYLIDHTNSPKLKSRLSNYLMSMRIVDEEQISRLETEVRSERLAREMVRDFEDEDITAYLGEDELRRQIEAMRRFER